MDWDTDLNILRKLPNREGLKGQLIRLIYHILEDHKGKSFLDLEDLMQQIYRPREGRPQPFSSRPQK